MQSLHEDILNTYQPQDTMERCLVDRITIAMVRQVRLCQAEAAKLKLSMRPEILAESLSQVLRHSTIRNFKAEDLTDDMVVEPPSGARQFDDAFYLAARQHRPVPLLISRVTCHVPDAAPRPPCRYNESHAGRANQ